MLDLLSGLQRLRSHRKDPGFQCSSRLTRRLHRYGSLVSVGDVRVRVDVHSMVSECQATICGYCKPDRVKAAVETCRLCCACDSAEGLVDVVVGWVDCEIPYLVLE